MTAVRIVPFATAELARAHRGLPFVSSNTQTPPNSSQISLFLGKSRPLGAGEAGAEKTLHRQGTLHPAPRAAPATDVDVRPSGGREMSRVSAVHLAIAKSVKRNTKASICDCLEKIALSLSSEFRWNVVNVFHGTRMDADGTVHCHRSVLCRLGSSTMDRWIESETGSLLCVLRMRTLPSR